MECVLILHDLDRPEVVQVFGPYSSEADADIALADLSEWPMLRGSWEIKPLHRHLVGPAPSVPLYPPPSLPLYPAQPAPQWPYGQVVWCGAEQPPYSAPGWTGCAPAATTAYTIWTTGATSSPRGDEPPDIAVPARV